MPIDSPTITPQPPETRVISQEELAAFLNASLPASSPVENISLAIHSNGSLDVACQVVLERVKDAQVLNQIKSIVPSFLLPKRLPVMLRGQIVLASPQSLRIIVQGIAVYGIPVNSPDLLRQVEDELNRSVNQALAAIPGLVMEELRFSEGNLIVVGNMPGSPLGQGQASSP